MRENYEQRKERTNTWLARLEGKRGKAGEEGEETDLTHVGSFMWYRHVKKGVGLSSFFQHNVQDRQKSGPVLLIKSQAEQGRKFTQPRDHFLALLYMVFTLTLSLL